MKSENIIRDKSYHFALKIIVLYRKLISEKEFIISKQLLRSGTSIGANVEEATAGVSKKDFAYKMSIASKEARETKYWLKLLRDSVLTDIDIKEYLNLADELVRILTAIVKSSKSGNKIYCLFIKKFKIYNSKFYSELYLQLCRSSSLH